MILHHICVMGQNLGLYEMIEYRERLSRLNPQYALHNAAC